MVATVTYSLQTIQSQFQANSWEDQNQLAPDVLGLSNGGYVVAYNNADINNGYILVDFYNAAGANFGYSIPYTVDGGDTFGSTDAVGAPSLTQLENTGNVVVVWADPNATSPGIRATIFNENGGVVTPEFTVTPFNTDRTPQVTALDGGGFVVSYEITGGTVLATIFDDAGNITTGEFLLNTTNGAETEPTITGLADGGFVATWTYDDGSGNLVVMARIFNADGTPRTVNGSTDEFVVGAFGDNSQPSVAALPDGNWAVVYTDSGWADENVGITLTIMGPNGEVVNSFAKVNDTTDPENEFDPDVTVLANGFIVVSWTYPFDPGVDDDIYFRIFDQDGNPVSINGYSGVQVLDASFDDDVASAVSAILAGKFVAAWQDTATDGAGGQITASVHELVRTIDGDNSGEALVGDALRDIINGNGGNDALTGFGGNDLLDGGTGGDSMSGGNGNDTYVVDNAGDTASEASGSGADLVQSAVTFTLAAGIENLTLNGAAAINGTGNSGANTINGNSAANLLSGLGANDALTGYGGADRLDGGAGGDAMIGGNGNDTYVVDNAGDTASEASGSGTDLVQSTVTFTLANGVENLVLNGGAAINGTGNAGLNTITGNSAGNQLNGLGANDTLTGFGGNDRLDGGANADAMTGGNGNDTYIVDNAGDTVSEAGGSGIDSVQSSITFTLGAGLDNLALTGAAVINGTGNGGANTMSGNSAANRLDGNGANDTLTGFGGADVFVFDDGDGADTVTDFANGSDKFDVSAVAAVNNFSDLTVIDNGATVTVNYGTGSFTIGNVGNPAVIDASDFVF